MKPWRGKMPSNTWCEGVNLSIHYIKRLTEKKMDPLEFSRNTQSWQCWYFCITSNANKLEVVNNGINFNEKFTFAMMFYIKIEVIDNYIHLILKVKEIQKRQHCLLCVLRENSIACYIV